MQKFTCTIHWGHSGWWLNSNVSRTQNALPRCTASPPLDVLAKESRRTWLMRHCRYSKTNLVDEVMTMPSPDARRLDSQRPKVNTWKNVVVLLSFVDFRSCSGRSSLVAACRQETRCERVCMEARGVASQHRPRRHGGCVTPSGLCWYSYTDHVALVALNARYSILLLLLLGYHHHNYYY